MRGSSGPTRPDLRWERSLLRGGSAEVAGVDEVGRGALAGPVTVGVVVVHASVKSAPTGLRDSKLLAPATREALVPRLCRWAARWGVGHASARYIDRHGIMAALRYAAVQAFATAGGWPEQVILDGSHDWLSAAFAHDGDPASRLPLVGPMLGRQEPRVTPTVCTRVKADLRCSTVAAASVLAKVARDEIMAGLDAEHPRYRWRDNKGYASPGHLAALSEYGACELHRRSWRLPGVAATEGTATGPSDDPMLVMHDGAMEVTGR